MRGWPQKGDAGAKEKPEWGGFSRVGALGPSRGPEAAASATSGWTAGRIVTRGKRAVPRYCLASAASSAGVMASVSAVRSRGGGERGGFFLRAAEDAAEPGGIGAEGWAQGGEGGLARAREFVFGHAVGGEAVADGDDGLGEFGGHGGFDDAAGGDVAVAGKRVARGAVGAGAAGAADLLADFHAEAVAADGGQQGETAVALAVHAGGRGPGEVHMAQRNFGGDGGGLGKGRGRVWFRGRGAFPGWRRRPRRWLRGGDRRGNFDGPERVVGGDDGGVGVAGDRGNACDHDIAARRGERGV